MEKRSVGDIVGCACSQAVGGIIGLKADELLRLGVDQGLVDEVELLRRDGLAQVGLEADAILLLRLQLRREIARAPAAGVLR